MKRAPPTDAFPPKQELIIIVRIVFENRECGWVSINITIVVVLESAGRVEEDGWMGGWMRRQVSQPPS